VLLNKLDLFEEKLPRRPIACCFPDFPAHATLASPGARDPLTTSLDFIKRRFLDCNRHNRDRSVHVITASATDSRQFLSVTCHHHRYDGGLLRSQSYCKWGIGIPSGSYSNSSSCYETPWQRAQYPWV
jgi:hypothetical protein